MSAKVLENINQNPQGIHIISLGNNHSSTQPLVPPSVFEDYGLMEPEFRNNFLEANKNWREVGFTVNDFIHDSNSAKPAALQIESGLRAIYGDEENIFHNIALVTPDRSSPEDTGTRLPADGFDDVFKLEEMPRVVPVDTGENSKTEN